MAHLLDLSTTSNDAPLVRIDGVEYRLTNFDDLSPRETFELQRIGGSLSAMAGQPLGEPEFQKFEEAVNWCFALIAGEIPEDVRAALKFGARTKLVDAFFTSEAGKRAPGNLEGQSPSPNGPQKPSPDFNDSTEGGPTNG